MRILLAIARHDYGKVANGSSYEFNSWFGSLRALGHDVEVFDTFDPRWRGDPDVAGRALEAEVSATSPDLVLMMLIERDVSLASIDRIRASTPIANWFADDTWRYPAFSRFVAPHFTWVVTTSRTAEAAYRQQPDVRALFSPWGHDVDLYHPVPGVEPDIDVGFVGQRYGRRGDVIAALSKRFDVVARGSGWPGGRLEADELAHQFARTRINLNFLECSAGPFQRRGLHFRGTWRADRAITRRFPPPTQLKARPFEITACGGFLLTNTAPELPEFFGPGEIGVFTDERSLPDRIAYYLEHEDQRREIAAAGLRRAQAYTWPAVLADVLDRAMVAVR